MLSNKKGFTLIELVMIIVILGILAAVAIPRYVDLKTDADKANAKGVLGGLNSASSVAYAAYLMNKTRCGSIAPSTPIDYSNIGNCLDGGFPANWQAGGSPFVQYTDSAGTVHQFTVTAETSVSKASVASDDFAPGIWP